MTDNLRLALVANACAPYAREDGRAELWRDFAAIVPIAVVAELIGLPSDDAAQLRMKLA